MPEEYTFLLYKSYSRESRTDFLGKQEWQNRRIPGNREREIPGMKHLLYLPILFETITSIVAQLLLSSMHSDSSFDHLLL
jgi:hypothetical protein